MAKKDPKEEEKDDEKPADAAGEGEAKAEGEEDAGGEEGGKKLDAKKIVLFVVLPLFVLAGIGGGLYFTGTLDRFLKKGGGEAAHGEASAEGGHGKGGEGKDGHGGSAANTFFLEIPDMTVNLATTDGQPRYLRLKVQLELESADDMHAVEAVMPRVVDQFQTYLRELRVKDLRGSAGMYRLQMELLSRVNAAAYPVEVKDVLFQEILIQ